MLYDLGNRVRAFGESRRLNVSRTSTPRWIINVHAGDDYAETYGQDRVVAVQSGRVIFVGWSSTYGNQVHVRSSSSLVIRYHSLGGESALEVGDTVTAGVTPIGLTGRSASGASGNHVHVQAEIDGKPVDPRPYIAGTTAASTATTFDNTTEADLPDMNEYLNTPAYDGGPTISQVFRDLRETVTAANVAKAVWETKVRRGDVSITALQELADAKTIAVRQEAQIAALTVALSSVAGGAVDLVAVRTAAQEGAEKALQNLTLTAKAGG